MISVVIPAYNAESTIARAINSVIAQSIGDWELIIIDDGSIDATPTIIDRYASRDSRIKVVHKENSGVSAARNDGIKLATGEWITFLDSDDYFGKGFFEFDQGTEVDMVLQREHVFGDQMYNRSYPEGKYLNAEYHCFLNQNVAEELFRAPWGKFLRLSVIKNHGILFSSQYRLGEDALFMLHFYKYCTGIESVASADYMYYLSGDFIARYKVSIETCLCYVRDVYNAYKIAGIDNQHYLLFTYTFYTGVVISHKKKEELHRWFADHTVKELQSVVTSLLPLKTRLKYFLYRILVITCKLP